MHDVERSSARITQVVSVGQPTCDLTNHVHGDRYGHATLRFPSGTKHTHQVLTMDELHGHVVVGIHHAEVIDLHNVRVIQ